jgi:hypothetical protein
MIKIKADAIRLPATLPFLQALPVFDAVAVVHEQASLL